ncbi:MAG: hypothetical protein KI790_10725 [Cyclobacteriaceae bacterium]|nr:hypothetical protein [Cyclobacteriaceae bacterium HetDA_MAG_MS6]
MAQRIKNLLLLIAASLAMSSCNKSIDSIKWQINLHTATGDKILVSELSDLATDSEMIFKVENFTVTISTERFPRYTAVDTEVISSTVDSVFVSLDLLYPRGDTFQAYNFNGSVDSKEMFRQSPHDLNAWIAETIPMQAVPVIAAQHDASFYIAISDAPFHYDNFTSQLFDIQSGVLSLRSGDDGISPGVQPAPYDTLDLDYNTEKTQVFTTGRVIPYYHVVSPDQSHKFQCVVLSDTGNELTELRESVNTTIASHFGKMQDEDYFGALSFSTPYMNLRVNETGRSDLWVIPAVEYGNTQYGRDAFWISTMLSNEYSGECLKNELNEVNHFAEYPLFAVIWAYRAHKEGIPIDLSKVQAYVDAIEKRVLANTFYSFYEGDGRLDFQYWGDLMAFEKNDVITYNQGLFVVALIAAERLGLALNSSPAKAAAVFNSLYDQELGYFPVSRLKGILSPDAIVADLLAKVYLDTLLLPSERVASHFDRMVKNAKTEFGFKVVSTPTGEFLPLEEYDIPGYKSQVSRGDWVDGEYFRGGSYFLYDNLFLMTCYLHGIEDALELLEWRIGLDFSLGGTTYEHINTLTGEPNKPNMGWNVAVYALWNELVSKGLASRDLILTVNRNMIKE